MTTSALTAPPGHANLAVATTKRAWPPRLATTRRRVDPGHRQLRIPAADTATGRRAVAAIQL